ncbi:MAG: DUF1836 domain-containing protein [Lachnospiraceae bacterium]|jgi:hypothetical protein|nr:DUF1836 domain-containing protein [Lachnospiraceae bacterium]
MTIDMHDLLNSIVKSLDRTEYVRPEDVPDIELYMDQVTTFMEQRLKPATRNPEDDKIMTKTMINNYVKNHLMPPPDKKKYSKEHMLLLIFIYYFKGFMSIGDIQTLMEPLTKQYFGEDRDFKLEDIYREVFSMEKEEIDSLKKDVIRKFRKAEGTFEEAPEKGQEFLKMFSFICLLCFDVYLKKMMIEKMIDSISELKNPEEMEKAEKEKRRSRKGEE